MTREEAIKELEILKEDYWDDDGYGHKTKQYDDTILALDMAIKALEQEPILDRDCEHCSKTYGTLECCTTVSNKWVYSCKEGQREYLLDKIRAELHATAEMHEDGDYYLRDEWIDEYFDKYKAESEK